MVQNSIYAKMSPLWVVVIPAFFIIVRKYREYTWGHFSEKKSYEDKIIIITGASAGLGKATAKELAKRKARVIMGCRDLTKANEAIQDIRKSVNTGELIPLELDLASLDSVRKFAKAVQTKFDQVHVLINNAGISANDPGKTKDGFEMHFGVNHLGHFLLTNLLMENLRRGAPSRIVIVSSSLHEHGNIDLDDLQGYKYEIRGGMGPNPAYKNSKLANVYFCRELAHRLHGEGVEVFAVCPGFCYTELFRDIKIKWYHYILFAPMAFFFMRSAHHGAQTILYAALSKDVTGLSGMLFRNCQLYRSSYNFDDEIQKKLWIISEGLVKQ